MDLAPQPSILFTIAMFALVIGVLVTVHEFGHYLVGRWFGVKAEAFSVGFGKELVGWTDRRGTRWRLSALPLGGYVKFAGDMNAASVPDPHVASLPPEEYEKTFNAKPLWQRALIVAAGPATNFLFAILIFAAFFAVVGHPYTPPVVSAVRADSAAAEAGIQAGDRILAVDGARVDRFEDILRVVPISTGAPMMIELERGGERRSLIVRPKVVEETDRFGNSYRIGMLGVEARGSELERVDPFSAAGYAVSHTWNVTKMIIQSMGQILSGERSVSELGGPLKIAQVSGQQASLGAIALVQLIAVISINLGFVNLLPVPVLDGGHLLLYAVEGVRRRPLSPRVQELAFMSGFAALITLMLFLTWNDLASFGVWKQIAGPAG